MALVLTEAREKRDHMQVELRGLQARINGGNATDGQLERAFYAVDGNGVTYNPHPHIAGVAVLGRIDLHREFLAKEAAFFADKDVSTNDRLTAEISSWLRTPAAQGTDADAPSGEAFAVTYFDLADGAHASGQPTPKNWFSGPRDRRFGFAADGVSFGQLAGS